MKPFHCARNELVVKGSPHRSADPQPSYEEIGKALAMPIGSIGPTRGRALQRLRRGLEPNEDLGDLAA